jgi:uncharacterized protein YciI
MSGERSKGPARRSSAPKKSPAAAPPPPPKPGKLFAVTLSRGPAWNSDLPLEQQTDWDAHAAVMDALEAEGFVAIGGPLDDTPYVLLAIRAEDPMAVRARLETDPWHVGGLLEISRIAPWTLRLGVGKL